jgi:hypothetical protein
MKLRHIVLAIIVFSATGCHNLLGLTNCTHTRDLQIGPYTIAEGSCIGPVGPRYQSLSVYKGKKHLGSGFQKDSCTILADPKDGLHMVFDICKNEVIEMVPAKQEIDLEMVDSVLIFSNELKISKRLSSSKTERFIKDWNRSKVDDYRDEPPDSIFWPNYQYRLEVYTQTGKREFLGFNFLVSDRTHWTYTINKKENLDYFHKLWRE